MREQLECMIEDSEGSKKDRLTGILMKLINLQDINSQPI